VIFDPLRQDVASDRGEQTPKVDVQFAQHLTESSSEEDIALNPQVFEQSLRFARAQLIDQCRGPEQLEAHIRWLRVGAHFVRCALEVPVAGNAQWRQLRPGARKKVNPRPRQRRKFATDLDNYRLSGKG
jgi:hypothetical protein